MRKTFTRMLAIIVLVLGASINVNSADVLLYFTTTQGASPATYSTGDKLYATATSTSSVCAPATFRTGSINGTVLQLVSTSASKIIIQGNSSGATSSRDLTKVELSSDNANWTDITASVSITGQLYGPNCQTVTVSNLTVAQGSFLRFTWNGNVQYNVFTITPHVTSPTVARTSGSNPASAMETLAMTPVVFTYSNVADDANVLADWYTDNTYSSTTSAPGGLAIAKNTTA